MNFIGDFHIHSHYSRATSKDLTPESLHLWASLKGIKVVGTGDFTHPGWIKELREKLEPAEQGLFKLKDEYKKPAPFLFTEKFDDDIRFILTSEISSIYKKNGKVRKIHNMIFAPDFASITKIQDKLNKKGANLVSDGRPILGMDSRDLLELCLESSDKIFFVPAHIWTPWFSILGDKSGFDSIEECFEDLSDHIFAVETGLSSDAPMNWLCSFLDKKTLISNSDAHSPEKLGRNANIFNTGLSYDSIISAMKTGHPERFLGTIDMFPQEGKYHYDGHRKCNVCWDPLETLKNNELCPECGTRVTVGVMNRVAQLADRKNTDERPNRLPFHSTIPLKEILSEIHGVGPSSKKIASVYLNILKKTGPELFILLKASENEILQHGDPMLSEAVSRMRNRQVQIQEGFDGEYGNIKVFNQQELESPFMHGSLFSDMKNTVLSKFVYNPINFDMPSYQRLKRKN